MNSESFRFIFRRTINIPRGHSILLKNIKSQKILTQSHIFRSSEIECLYLSDSRDKLSRRTRHVLYFRAKRARARKELPSERCFRSQSAQLIQTLASTKAWNKGEAAPFYENYISHFIFAFQNGSRPVYVTSVTRITCRARLMRRLCYFEYRIFAY